MNGILLSDDLIFISRISATGKAHGLTVIAVKTAESLLKKVKEDQPGGVILDLQNPTLELPALIEELRLLGSLNVVAYGSHVDVDRLKAAREAGIDQVMPRSQFVEKLESELASWLS